MQTTTSIRGYAKFAAAVLASLILVVSLSMMGCSSAASAAATLSESIDSETATARVTAVDGDTVTIQIMEDMGQSDHGPDATDNASSDAASTTDQASTSTEASASDSADSAAPAGDSSDMGTPPDLPSGEAPSGDMGTPPDMPSGEAPSGDMGTPPDMPSGEAPSGDASSDSATASDASSQDAGASSEATAGDDSSAQTQSGAPSGGMGGMPGGTEATLTISDQSIIYTSSDGSEVQGSISDITEGSMLTLTVSGGTTVTKIVVSSGMGGHSGAPGGSSSGSESGGSAPGGSSSSGSVENGTGATTITSATTEDGQTYAATGVDENALRVESGASATISNATVTKSGDSSSSESSDFYGLNAGVLAYDGSSLTLSNANITTTAKGANGVFAYGEGTTVEISDSTISTSQGNSGGIEVSGGATLNASNLTVDTQGQSSAAIRSDRGGGTENVDGGTYTTHGEHSPAIYCTADVNVQNATLYAENSEGVVIEGLNSVDLVNCLLTANVNNVQTRTGLVPSIMIYQSMSGDAEQGTGSFTMSGGKIISTGDTLFYVTNTSATIDLSGVDISSVGNLLNVSGNDDVWGNSGSNGGQVQFTANGQTMSGDIIVDAISSLELALTNSSSYTGAINTTGAAGTVNVALDAGSTWTLTGDSYITSLSGDTSGINTNGFTLYVNGVAWTA